MCDCPSVSTHTYGWCTAEEISGRGRQGVTTHSYYGRLAYSKRWMPWFNCALWVGPQQMYLAKISDINSNSTVGLRKTIFSDLIHTEDVVPFEKQRFVYWIVDDFFST